MPRENPPSVVIFSACLSSLWSIWELLIFCEPILIFGPSPRITSLAVWWLRDLIRPVWISLLQTHQFTHSHPQIPLAGDFRPYITIHDRDYTTFINKNPPRAGLVIGVTNPFILSVTKHWPNILSLGWEDKNVYVYFSNITCDSHLVLFSLAHNSKGKPSRDMPGSGPVPGFVAQTHKRYSSKDRPLLKTWETALEKGGHFGELRVFSGSAIRLTSHLEHIASQSLRRHFSSRTASFLAPLNRYLHSLIPSPVEASVNANVSPRSKPRLKPFNSTHFLGSLKTHGTPLSFRSSTKQREFYERWLRTPAFALWLANQEEVVTGVLEDNGGRGIR